LKQQQKPNAQGRIPSARGAGPTPTKSATAGTPAPQQSPYHDDPKFQEIL
jgi:hypothetical protein